MLIVIAAILGLLTGMTASMLGIGGGVLLVPLLHILFGLEMHEAVGTSLFIVFFLSSLAAFSYLHEKLTLWKLGLVFGCGGVPGAYVGSVVSYMVPSTLLRIAFSILVLYLSIRMWRKKSPSKSRKMISKKSLNLGEPKTVLLLLLLGFMAGFLSGLLGIGGGVVVVPIMNLLLGIPIHNSIATSVLTIVISTLAGSSTHMVMGGVRYDVGLWIAPSAMLGSYLGTKISVKLKGILLSRIFSILLLFIAVRMFLST